MASWSGVWVWASFQIPQVFTAICCSRQIMVSFCWSFWNRAWLVYCPRVISLLESPKEQLLGLLHTGFDGGQMVIGRVQLAFDLVQLVTDIIDGV